MSKYILNSFQTPNAIIDDLMPLLTDSEFRLLMFMVRQILGWESSVESKRAKISQSVMESGYTYIDKNGEEQTQLGCGLRKGAIKNALNNLKLYRIIKAIGKPTNDGQLWELCLLTDSNPDMVSLKLRADTKIRKAKKQTIAARKVNPKNVGGTVQQIPFEGDCSTDTQGDCSTDTNKTQETQETHVRETKQPESDFVLVRRAVEKLGVLVTQMDNELFGDDFNHYSKQQWFDGIEKFKQRRKEKNEYLPYKYLASIVRGLVAEEKQAELSEMPNALELANKRAASTQAAMMAELNSYKQGA